MNLKRLPSGRGLILGKPKTKSSIRSIKIGNESIEVLKRQKDRNNKERELAIRFWKENDLVFPSTIGTANDPSNVLKKFRQLLKKAGLPKIRFHDLRHTAAALMLNNSVDVIVASKRLGHAKPSITMDVYGHLLSSVQNEVADKIEMFIFI